ncbi:Gfo/Idh/MocA family oxidoreductase [Jiangella aurantiaca]|uniref:Gfo/Idh/MocA family oxidoreductase n=1 Tax=Jiangella aurantiaca TaxID=2530373 RepID=UPI0013A5E8C5|nr:Gfo/Idh/MocA family oxidoreductase [Jiangella aurantiaca]
MTRIGVVGTDSSHVDQFVRLLNVEHRHGDARVVALAGGDTERNRALAAAAGADVPRLVEAPGDLVGVVDAVLICTRDGRAHRAEAIPLIEAGLPVFVDKPLAGSAADAAAIVDAARAHAVPLYEGSALRFVPAIAELAGDRPTAVHVTGPADPAGPYGGLYFYGVHLAETALQLIGELGDAGPVDLRTSGLVVTALTTIGDVHVTLTFVAGEVPFHATVVRASGVRSRELALPPDYTAPVLERFLAVAAKGEPPDEAEAAAMVAPVALIDAVTAQLG